MYLKRDGPPPPWLFGITALPYGVSNGFVTAAMPYLLRNAGLTVESFSRLGRMPIDMFNKLFWSIIEAGVTLITLKNPRVFSRKTVRSDRRHNN